jgi:hypothetical protein
MATFTAFGSLANRVTTLENEVGPSGSGIDYIVKVSGDKTAEDAVADAEENYVGILVGIAEEADLTLPAAGSRVDGTVLRFFNNGSNNSVSPEAAYNVKEIGGVVLFQILPQEAYSMIWRAAQADWVVVPGIMNAKSNPGEQQ